MITLVERVAQAICGDDNPDNILAIHRDRARAAIEVMRPTDAAIERAAEALRAYEFQHIEGVLEGTKAWGNLNEKIKQHYRGKVRVVVDSIEVAE